MLTSNFNKPSCRLLELFIKNLAKISQFLELRKFTAVAELRKFQNSSGLRKFLNYLDLENFSITELRNFSIQGKFGKKLRENFLQINT